MDIPFMKPAALLLFFTGFAFAVYSALPRSRPGLGTAEQPAANSDQARLILIFRPFYSLLMPVIQRLPLGGYRERMGGFIITAGMDRDIGHNDVIGFQITMAALFLGCAMWLFDSSLIRLLSPILGFCYPYLWLKEKKKQRQQAVVMSMPDIVDMLALSVEAGASFSAAVQKVCDIYRNDGHPFVAELYLLDKNLRLGRSTEEALKTMAERVDVMELDSFCSILIQANRMGSSISPVLRAQAERMRSERFMKAERLGAQASQKLLIPMMIFIFPIIFIVIFGPYIVQMIMG